MAEEAKIRPDEQPPVKDTDADKGGGEETLLAGKFKTTEELEKGHGELEKTFGEQSTELGEARTQTKELTNQLLSAQKQIEELSKKPDTKEEAATFQSQLTGIKKQVTDGDITFEDGMEKAALLAAQIASDEALERSTTAFNQKLEERDQDVQVKQFHKDNPEFQELLDSGEIEKEKAKNPMHDNLSAFLQIKADNNFKKGIEEAERLRSGSDPTKTVLDKPGSSMREEDKKPVIKTLDKVTLRDSMADAIKDIPD